MISKYLALLENDKILSFVTQKYELTGGARDIALREPYYRFLRIFELIGRAHVPVGEHSNWLDLGCHHGQFANLVRALFHCTVTGLDDWELKETLPWAEFDYLKVDLAQGDWPSLVQRRPMHVISALEVIEHMIDTDKFLTAIKSIAGQNSYLIISTPNINSLRNRVLVPFGVYPAAMEYQNTIHHVRLFNRRTLTQLLRDNGFVVRHCIGVSFLPERMLRVNVLRHISEAVATRLPQLCGNLVVIAQLSANAKNA